MRIKLIAISFIGIATAIGVNCQNNPPCAEGVRKCPPCTTCSAIPQPTVSASACPTPPAPHSPMTSCEQACHKMRDMGCKEAETTPQPVCAPCELVCEDTNKNKITSFHDDCIISDRVKKCSDIDSLCHEK